MALQRVETDAIEDDAVTTAKIAPNAIAAADIAADAITNVKVAAGAAIAVAKISGLGTAAALNVGTAANNVVQLDGSGRLPAVSGANLTGVSTDTSAMENNIAILAFKTQAANNLAKFNLVGQVVDEYKDGTGATYSTAGQTGSTATDGYLSTYTLTTGLGALTDMGVANFGTGGSGNIAQWSWGSGASSNDLTAWNSSSELGGTTDGAATPIVFAADTEFEFHWYPSGTYGPYVAIVPSSYSGNNNVHSTSEVLGTIGAMSIVNIAASHYIRYNQSGSSSNVVTEDFDGTNCKFVRDSNNYLKFYSNGVLKYTSVATHSDAYEICISQQGGNSSTASNLQYKIETQVASTPATGTATSTANTALSAPTTGDIVLLIEEVDGVAATLNTAGNDLRCAISRNGGTGWDYVTLVNKGLWGTNKKILVANGVPFSNSASGTDMRYKLEWANQAAGGDTDHSTTTGWAQSGTIANLFDNNNSTSLGTGGGGTQWFTTDLGSAKAITKYTMTSFTGGSNASPSGWNIKGSNDTTNGSNGTWSSALDTKSGQSVWGSNEKRSFTFSNSTAYRYWKIEMTATGGGAAPELAEMEYITTATGRIVRVHATSLAWA